MIAGLNTTQWLSNKTKALFRGICSCDTDAVIISATVAACNAIVLDLGHGRLDFYRGLLRVDKRSLGDGEIDPPLISRLLREMCVLVSDKHFIVVLNCGCGMLGLQINGGRGGRNGGANLLSTNSSW